MRDQQLKQTPAIGTRERLAQLFSLLVLLGLFGFWGWQISQVLETLALAYG